MPDGSELVRPRLTTLAIADPPERWEALGFAVDADGRVNLGGVTVILGGAGEGITGWHVDAAPGLSAALGIDEVAFVSSPAQSHPNGVIGLDHVVVLVPDFDATAAALEQIDLPFRRVRQASDTVRQGFRRLGPAILEVVEAPQAERPALWGLVPIVADLDVLGTVAAPHVKPHRPAIQPGRQIVPVGRSAGLSTQLAFMDPEPGPDADPAATVADQT